MKSAAAGKDWFRGQASALSARRWPAMKPAGCRVIAMFCALLLAAPDAASQDNSPPWVSVEYDKNASAARVTASIDILASPKTVYTVMVDCSRTLRIVKGLESCRVIEKSADGKWDIREHIISISVLLPRVRNVFRSDYDQNSQIRFHRVDGDLRVSEGKWRLQPIAGGTATRVLYQSRVALFAPVPGFLVREAIRQDIPNVLNALRHESLASEIK